MSKHEVRPAQITDVPAIHSLILELATYERAADQMILTVEQLAKDGFGENPLYRCLVAESEQQIVGIALYYYRYSTWKGKCIYLEDIVVRNAFRGKGIGKTLLDATVEICLQEKVNMLTWQVLDWNEPAIHFYEKFEANFDNEWINCKLTKSQMQAWKFGKLGTSGK
ncbi:MAG: GNAT family N-acetyltransferase [Bacteroidetes bacterium]|nr:MAG: GNAT family N-acetyltransferase [Bacteroidota bacterium]